MTEKKRKRKEREKERTARHTTIFQSEICDPEIDTKVRTDLGPDLIQINPRRVNHFISSVRSN